MNERCIRNVECTVYSDLFQAQLFLDTIEAFESKSFQSIRRKYCRKKNCSQMQAAYVVKSVHFQPSLQRFSPSKQVVQLLKDIVIIHRYLN